MRQDDGPRAHRGRHSGPSWVGTCRLVTPTPSTYHCQSICNWLVYMYARVWYTVYIYIYIHTTFIKYTSSTAQGGGGSFKNRKPIGEIGCCESGMAERSHWWTERCLISLTLSLSFYLPTYPSIFYVSIYLSLHLSIYCSCSCCGWCCCCLFVCLLLLLLLSSKLG